MSYFRPSKSIEYVFSSKYLISQYSKPRNRAKQRYIGHAGDVATTRFNWQLSLFTAERANVTAPHPGAATDAV